MVSPTRLHSFGWPITMVAGVLLFAGGVQAQTPRIHPGARGFETNLALKQAAQQRARSVPQAPTQTYRAPATPRLESSPLEVTVEAPRGRTQVTRSDAGSAVAPAVPFTVAIRGPDGEVRRYPVEGGPSAIVIRRYAVNPGQVLTISVNPE
ncbi:MAG: hypothetical protein U0840_16595 [Gemmataceae bacterium]